ncbi:MAG: M23 family metallopeptidase, partial [Chloroflexi bacterium]|nr:M23 family metallopeptidase [Chloroflexota bacterium]
FGFVWPVVDLITSYYGPYHPLGIDINAPVGVPIVASAAGQVVFVGGDSCCSYGFHVEIKHDETYTTLYAHLNSYAVELGQQVEQGQVLGFSGLTGRSTGPHLHFEIRRDDIQQDPLLYLP